MYAEASFYSCVKKLPHILSAVILNMQINITRAVTEAVGHADDITKLLFCGYVSRFPPTCSALNVENQKHINRVVI